MALIGKKRPRALSGKAAQPKKKQKVALDSLKWTSVSMPDHLDDYEGFYGLEEIDGVDIVQNESNGQISFEAFPDSTKVSTEEGKDEITNHDGAFEDEWSGFDDDDDDDDEEATSGRFASPNSSNHDHDAQPAHKKAKVLNGNVATQKHNPQQRSGSSAAFTSLVGEDSTDLIDSVDVSAWNDLKLMPDTLAALAKLKFSKPTPIQEAAIPDILAGHDVIGKASTGSGKTLAFGIPILEAYLENGQAQPSSTADNKSPIALILSPTRELAHQLDKHLSELCASGVFEAPRIATLTGGLAVPKQQRLLRNADIVIGTPGRLWEIISQGRGIMAALQKIKFLIIDEADRLLSEGHFKEVEEILNALGSQEEHDDGNGEEATSKGNSVIQVKEHPRDMYSRQTLVFSATFDRGLQKKLATRKFRPDHNLMDKKDTLARLLSKLNFREESPRFIDVNPVNQLATGLKEALIECASLEKDLYLYTLLLLHPNTRALVFANSVDAVRRLTPFLQHLNLSALALHSGMAQKARLRSVERFKEGSASILVASDVAARGLDIPEVQLVIHYDLPRAADTYVHRSGRTARAGLSGSSILICSPEAVNGVRDLVAKVHVKSRSAGDNVGGSKRGIQTLEIDRRIVTRLKPRAVLAKKVADATIAKEKRSKEDDFMRAAAEELGRDYDSDEFEAEGRKGRRGRGAGRKKKEREAAGLSKAEVGAMKAELKGLLKQRVNVGVSEKYLTSGKVDVDALLRQQEAGAGEEFLGNVQRELLD